MKRTLAIMKKELLRVLKSPRMLAALLLPGLIIFVMYTVLGDAIQNQVLTDEEEALAATYTIYAVNMPSDLDAIIKDGLGYTLEINEITEVGSETDLLLTEDAELILDFDADFMTAFLAGTKPSFKVYYNPYVTKSNYAYTRIFSPAFNLYKDMGLAAMLGRDDVDLYASEVESIYDSNKAEADLMAMMVPMLIIMFLFSGCMAVTPESIAGEKERGTMSTLLATPVKRKEIAIGKLTALSILAVISGASSFIGMMASLPKLMGTSSIFSLYSFADMGLLFLIIMSTVLMITGAMAVVSSFSKNIKEAAMLITPFMILGMVVGMLNMFLPVPTGFLFYLIPLYNTSASIATVLTFEINMLNLAITVIANVVYVVAFIWLLSRIFNSEKVMFSK